MKGKPLQILNGDYDQMNPNQDTPRIAVVGDIMIDVDLHCRCERLCQEGPWPVFSIERTQRRLGGAGNVARMTAALGATTLLGGICHMNQWATVDNAGIIAACLQHQATTKTRYWVDGRMIGPRVDNDSDLHPTSGQIDDILQAVQAFDPDAIIVADHGKGFVTQALMAALGDLNVYLFVDPVLSTPMIDGTICIAGEHEQPSVKHDPRGNILKLGPRGLQWKIDECSGAFPSYCRKVIDPLGAGDQFIAALAWQRCHNTDWPNAIAWANKAAGKQCEHPGCVPLTPRDINAPTHNRACG